MFSFTHSPGAVNVVRLLIITCCVLFADRVIAPAPGGGPDTRWWAQKRRESLSSSPRISS
jgi:hypothetical protein